MTDVVAVLVTRGDQPEMMERILDSLIFDQVFIWDNSVREDRKTAGRYYALLEPWAQVKSVNTPVVYFQDDDVIVPPYTQQRLVDAYMPGVVIANYGHGENDGGYGDLPLVCGGAVLDADLSWKAMGRYLAEHPADEDFLYYCDFAAGVLYEDFRHLYLPFEINMTVAQHESRLCNQPWAADMKLRVTERARAIRDRVPVAA